MRSPENITLRAIRCAGEAEQCVSLQRKVWGFSALDTTPSVQFLASVAAGGTLVGAWRKDGFLAGFSYAFPAMENGLPYYHSQMLAVHPTCRRMGVGRRLKLRQRRDVLREKIPFIRWTFDPLESGNARFNFGSLGVRAVRYIEDFYGQTTSPRHRGMPTDRLMLQWDLNDPEVLRKIRRQRIVNDESSLLRCTFLNDGREGPDRWLRPVRVTRTRGRKDHIAIRIPGNVQKMKKREPELALEWRLLIRKLLSRRLASGYEVYDYLPASTTGKPVDSNGGWFLLRSTRGRGKENS